MNDNETISKAVEFYKNGQYLEAYQTVIGLTHTSDSCKIRQEAQELADNIATQGLALADRYLAP
jgi:hypothetical protein